jgi:hypothetical protein
MARIIKSDSGTTVTRFFGTYQYCSPEHFGGKVNGRSDVYSLGATLYHMIAGVVPFGTSYINAKMHPNARLPPVPSILNMRPGLPAKVDKILNKALSKNPDERYGSSKELYDEFAAAVSASLTSGTPEPTRKSERLITAYRRLVVRSWDLVFKHPAVSLSFLVLVLLGAYLVFQLLRNSFSTGVVSPTTLTAFTKQTPVLLMFCDASSSMSDKGRQKVVSMAEKIFADLPEGTHYSIYPIYSDVRRLPAISSGVFESSPGSENRRVESIGFRREIESQMSALSKTSAARGTCILDNLRVVDEYFREYSDTSKFEPQLVILSDMIEECHPPGYSPYFDLHKTDIYDELKRAQKYEPKVELSKINVSIVVPLARDVASDKKLPTLEDLQTFWQIIFYRTGVMESHFYFGQEPPIVGVW